MERSARNTTRFLRIVFCLELFWAIFPSNPVESASIAIFHIRKPSTFVQDEPTWNLGEVPVEAQSSRGRGSVRPHALEASPDSGKALLRRRTVVVHIFHFLSSEVDFGLVSGDVRDSGLGISLFRFMQVPSKVPDGLMQVDEAVHFQVWGLF